LFLEMPSTLKYIISHNGELRKMWSSRKIQREFSFQWQKKIIVFTFLFNLQTVSNVCARLWNRSRQGNVLSLKKYIS
jgi:hypothetical protein